MKKPMNKVVIISILIVSVILLVSILLVVLNGEQNNDPNHAQNSETNSEQSSESQTNSSEHSESLPVESNSDQNSGDPNESDNPDDPNNSNNSGTSHEHVFGDWEITIPATCIDLGEQKRACSCGEKETQTIDALGHTEVVDPGVEPTCGEHGLTEGSHCSLCDMVLVVQETIPPTGEHTYVDDVCQGCSAQRQCSEGLAFASNGDGTCRVIGIGSCTDLDIVIPTISPSGDRVISIGDSAFYGCSSLTSITLPGSVSIIDTNAFRDCTGLTRITLPNSITCIGRSAFAGCTGLTAITVPDSVTSIGDWAFSDCTSLTSVVLGDGAKRIGGATFYRCSALTSITIPDGVTSIDDSAFAGCTSLTSIILPYSVTRIGFSTFSGCTALTDVYYTGTEQQWWETLMVLSGNNDFATATRHFDYIPEG